MHSLFGELGRRLADKWLSPLTPPGLLFLATAVVACALGHAHALDHRALARRAEEWAAALAGEPAAVAALALVAALLAASGAGLAVEAASGLTQRLWLGTWPRLFRPLARYLTNRRASRWQEAHEQVTAARGRPPEGRPGTDRTIDELAARRNRISLARPTRPTWMGDRVAAVESRVFHQYGLDLVSTWPRLWLVLPDHVRAELRTARTQFDTAATLETWGAALALLAALWWPAAPIALILGTIAWYRGRATVTTYTDLVEAAIDLHGRELAITVGGPTIDNQLTTEVGHTITRLFRKGA